MSKTYKVSNWLTTSLELDANIELFIFEGIEVILDQAAPSFTNIESELVELDEFKTTLELKYNGKIYHSYFDNEVVKFKIDNMKSFKNSKDKTLIIKKNGITKTLPFEWKAVYSGFGGI